MENIIHPAAPDEAVKVTFAGKESSTEADADGRWSVKLDSMKDGENLTLTVNGKNTITRDDGRTLTIAESG